MKEKTPYYEINIDEKALENIKAALESKAYVKVGVLGGDMTGYIAAVHEFGAAPRVTEKMRWWFLYKFGVMLKASTTRIRIPKRSFLQLTSIRKQDEFTTKLQSSRGKILDEIVGGRWASVLAKVGAIWVSFVHECFDTRGWGTWRPLSPLTIENRPGQSALPLQNTGKLKNSVSFEVVDA